MHCDSAGISARPAADVGADGRGGDAGGAGAAGSAPVRPPGCAEPPDDVPGHGPADPPAAAPASAAAAAAAASADASTGKHGSTLSGLLPLDLMHHI